ncbi:MAG: TonB-dependent receptor plug domain-containing protein, partial [Sphingomonadaceae bacterium]
MKYPPLVASASLLVLGCILAAPAHAQDSDPSADTPLTDNEILVLAERIRGQVDTSQPPIAVLNEEDIAAYGADSLTDLISQLSAQTGSGRGRGGRPVFLVNGQRVSGFREFHRYPPEAIRKVEILPEEVAQRFGYPADQRVINFILKDNFASREIEAEIGGPDQGGSRTIEAEGSLLTISGPNRMNISAEITDTTMLTEAERNIIQTPGSVPDIITDPDPARYRSLIADSRSYTVEGTWNTGLGEGGTDGNYSINGSFNREERHSLSGLDTVLLTAPGGTQALRALDENPLARQSNTTTWSLGSTLNKPLGDWQLAVTADASRAHNATYSDRRRDTSGLQAQAISGNLAIDGVLPTVPDAGQDLATSTTYGFDSKSTLRGNPFLLPAGDLGLTLDAGYSWDRVISDDSRSTLGKSTLTRGTLSGGSNLTIPLTSRREGFMDGLGDFTLTLGGGVDNYSDFGTLGNWTTGLTWQPVEPLTLQATWIEREAPPGLGNLGSPAIINYNVPVYDFTNNQTVLVSTIAGGNPSLKAEKQRDLKLSASLDVDLFDRTSLQVEYFRNRSDNVTTSFPLLTPAIEAAFPNRVTRDPGGQLVSIDRRPITVDSTRSARIRYGFNIFGRLSDDGGARGGSEPGDRQAPAPMGATSAPAPQPASQETTQDTSGNNARTGRPDPERFAALRQQLCSSSNPDEQPDLSNLPEPVLERLRGDNGQIDPARVQRLRDRLCSANPQGTAGAKTGPDAAPSSGSGSSGARTSSGAGFPGMPGRGPRGGRWNLSLYHTIELQNEALIAPGGPLLDMLHGDAVSSGGVSR